MVMKARLIKTYPGFKLLAELYIDGPIILVGRNGSGKTTLLRLIAGLERPDQGAIEVNGRNVTNLPPWQRRIAYVSPETYIPHMKVKDHLRLAQRMKLDHIMDLLREYSIPFEERVGKLSMGQREVVAILTAIAADPAALLIDEAASNISRRRELLERIIEIIKPRSMDMIYVSQVKEDSELFDSSLYIENGRLIPSPP
ncbi:MAG: ATP-binding cassette domain-containing protein [Thermocladium sp.]|jgi:ABC-type sugar transport system ATPase subunit